MNDSIRMVLTELIDPGEPSEDGTRSAKFRIHSGETIVFWGSAKLGFINIDMLRHQQLPIMIDLEDPELCMPNPYTKEKYNCLYSVNEQCFVTVHPGRF